VFDEGFDDSNGAAVFTDVNQTIITRTNKCQHSILGVTDNFINYSKREESMSSLCLENRNLLPWSARGARRASPSKTMTQFYVCMYVTMYMVWKWMSWPMSRTAFKLLNDAKPYWLSYAHPLVQYGRSY
jgi:hypothetical protein